MRYDKRYIERELTFVADNLSQLDEPRKSIPLNNDAVFAIRKKIVEKLTQTANKSTEVVEQFIDPELKPELQSHYEQSKILLKELLEIQKRILEEEINKIDPTPPGTASKISNTVYRGYLNATRKVGLGKQEEMETRGILKAILKPFAAFFAIFETATPDQWRVASARERVKIAAGVLLTATSIAMIIAAIVLSVTTPFGIVAGIGITVVYGSLALGLISVMCMGIGGVLLESVQKSIGAKFADKNVLKSLSKKCNATISKLDAASENVKHDVLENPSQKLDPSLQKETLMFTSISKTLEEVKNKVSSLKKQASFRMG